MSTITYRIITNNPLVADRLSDRVAVEFYADDTDRDILTRVRNLVHRGFRVLTQPLAGSVKPWETPYRSIMVSATAGTSVDEFSLDVMERSFSTLERSKHRPTEIAESILKDFQIVDLSLIESALPSAEAYGR